MRVIILTAVVLASLGTTLYQVKTSIDERQAELRRLQTEIATTQRDIAVLEAEWAFLSRPDRVMNLSASLLDMKPISRNRILPLDAIPIRLQADTDSAKRVSCVNC
jgi:cell division protein FtsL